MDSPIQKVIDSFKEIPLSDINLLLSIYNIPITNDPYQAAQTLILNNNLQTVPSVTIIDWILALHIANSGAQIPIYKSSDILFSKDMDLIPLAQTLLLPDVNKERMIRILGYLKLLDNDISVYDMFPNEVIFNILSNLSCKDILLTCKFSQRFSRLCQGNEFIQFMRAKITQQTGLITDQYNMDQLIRICRTHGRSCISVGTHHSLICTNDGQVYGSGNGKEGELGLFMEFTNIQGQVMRASSGPVMSRFTQIPGLDNIMEVSAGPSHSLVCKLDGTVYGFGHNKSGRLGNIVNTKVPTLIPGLNNIIKVVTGSEHSLVLRSDGTVYGFGNNYQGQLGLGSLIDPHPIYTKPILIPGLIDIIQISAETNYSLALTYTGQVYGFGSNGFGQLGLGDKYSRNSPTLIPNLTDIIQISTGATHSLALRSDGTLYGFGSNNHGQIVPQDVDDILIPTLIPTLNNIVQVAAGNNYSLVLTANGQVFGFGRNNSQLGLGIDANVRIPTLIPQLNNIIYISTGSNSSLVLTADGNIYGFGVNHYGQLGIIDPDEVETPTLVPNISL